MTLRRSEQHHQPLLSGFAKLSLLSLSVARMSRWHRLLTNICCTRPFVAGGTKHTAIATGCCSRRLRNIGRQAGRERRRRDVTRWSVVDRATVDSMRLLRKRRQARNCPLPPSPLARLARVPSPPLQRLASS
ncbi:hypothetical protein BaRGS_00027915 [Batillaria attramentaria]|uniref:Uncharacterized protein n=1 Tax=Batillaria attramentaria TaxID=370345 RepID=A0ABD0K0I0_9CAEN